ncbi:MAG: acetyl-CoA acetyltransferase [Bradymonadia bacterium]|jgi:acetyl-CoA acetyltransferase
MRDVAIVAYAHTEWVDREKRGEAELVQEVVEKVLGETGLAMSEIGFTCSGSSDYLIGRPFSFVAALDGITAWPPISESHVEMDGAWALYEAWVKIQMGHIDTALVYAFGKPSTGDINQVLGAQLDPYTMAPLGLGARALAGIQARALVDSGACEERDFQAVAEAAGATVDKKAAYSAAPLRAHDEAQTKDGAVAIVLAAGDRARSLCDRPAWIRAIEHRIEAHQLGLRDLTQSVSTAQAAEAAGAIGREFDIAEIHANFSHQDIMVRNALKLPEGTTVNPSGGAMANDPVMATGLARIGECAARIVDGTASSAVAHASAGPAMQQNMIVVLEAN